MNTIFITGGGRGIGLELCRLLCTQADHIVTTCREIPKQLNDLKVEVIKGIDMTDPECGNIINRQLGEHSIDMLIHNAGILSKESLDDMDFARIEQQFIVNTLGPLRVIHALLGRIKDGGKIGIVSSRMGSIEDNTSGGRYGYRISKAGANALGKSLAEDLKPRNIAVALLHPGLVATDMTGGNGIPPVEAANGIIKVMQQLDMAGSGGFYHAEGHKLPW